jgi:predicted ATPase/DNA-binding winged helix-turn-helix (wHTH) protein
MNIVDARFGRSGSQELICFGPFRLSVTARVLERGGVPIRLGSRALDILLALIERPNQVVTKKELIARVWPDLVVDEGSLRFHISALRKALGEGRSGRRYVTNVSGRGYCFVAPISSAAGPLLPSGNSLLLPAVGLPPSPSKMVGREEAVQRISNELATWRFVTIAGAGGIGKTTVATAVSHKMIGVFDGAVLYVDFGPLSTPALVPNMVASTVGLQGSFSDLVGALPSFLRDKRMLLVLDSCEHLIDAIAPLAERIFREAADVHILVTSREPLRVEGEHVHRLEALACPPEDARLTAAQVVRFPAVQLFLERAAAHSGRFELNDDDAQVVGSICRRLDGLALALELAAGRVGVYGILGLASLLDSSSKLLWHGRRTASPRHQTLSAMLDWSYNLLPESERLILRSLSVFVGAFSLEAAQFVAAEGALERAQVAESVASLATKSLVAVETGDGGTLCRLLDTTRSYLVTKIVDEREKNVTARRHAVYYREYLERSRAGPLASRKDNDAADHWRHLSNVRIALEWSFSDQGDKAVGTALAAASAPLFLELSLLSECQTWVERALVALDVRGDRRELELQEALAISLMLLRVDGAEAQTLTAALSLAQALELPDHQMRLLAAQHTFLVRTGDFHGAAAVAEQNWAVAQKAADPVNIMMADWMLGVSHHLLGDQARARRQCETVLNPAPSQNLDLIRSGYDQRIRAHLTLARSLWLQGYADRAVTVAKQALHHATALNHPVSLCVCWIYVTNVLLWAGDWSEAGGIIDRLIAYADQYSLAPYRAIGLGLKGQLSLYQGDSEVGLRLLSECLSVLGQHQALLAVFTGDLAIGLAQAGRFDEAGAAVDQALNHGGPARSHFYLPEIMRIKGEFLASSSHASDAEDWFSRSLNLAREQSALAWELRTATSLARLQARQCRCDEARCVLQPVYDRFTEGFDTPDLRVARDLLNQLKSDYPAVIESEYWPAKGR